MSDPNKSGSGEGAPENTPKVDVDAIVSKVVGSLKDDIAQMVTGAVKRNVSEFTSKFEGIDIEALKAVASASKDAKKGKVDPVQVEILDLKSRIAATEEREKAYRSRALSGEIYKALDDAKVNKDSRDLLAESLGRVAQEAADTGKVLIPTKDQLGNEVHKPLKAYLSEFLKDKPGLLESAARGGSGAGKASEFTEAMPKTKYELLFRTDKLSNGKTVKKATPDRRDAFIAQHGKAAWDALPMGNT